VANGLDAKRTVMRKAGARQQCIHKQYAFKATPRPKNKHAWKTSADLAVLQHAQHQFVTQRQRPPAFGCTPRTDMLQGTPITG
jgi:hypothetical protein